MLASLYLRWVTAVGNPSGPAPANPHLPTRQYDLRKQAQCLRHVIINIVPPSYFTICSCAFTDTKSLGRLEREPGICCLTQVLAAAPGTKWLILHSRVPTMQLPRRCFFASLVSAQCWPQFLKPAAKTKRTPSCIQQSPKTLLRTILYIAPEHIQAARATVENQSHTWHWPAQAEGMLAWAAEKLPETVQ